MPGEGAPYEGPIDDVANSVWVWRIGLLLWFVIVATGCKARPADVPPPEVNVVQRGRELFEHTRRDAPAYVKVSGLACGNCHSHLGRPDKALSLDGASSRYPAFNVRDGRVISLQERIRGCFKRSLNGEAPADDAPEMAALVAYINSLPAAEKRPAIVPEAERIALKDLDAGHGSALYQIKCASCHQADGGGTAVAFPPLWGPHSYNDGAGLARIYTLAWFIHEAMPYGNGGSVNYHDAQDIAAFINSQDRPQFAAKKADYPGAKIPIDAVYYLRP